MRVCLSYLGYLALLLVFEVNGAEVIGNVVITKNQVEAQQGDKKRELTRRSKIMSNDLVTTGKKARAQFRLSDGTLFTLGEVSQLEMVEYQYSPKQPAIAKFKLLKGVFRSITGKITQVNNPNFVVETPMGSIGIRGTDFWGGYLEQGKIDVILLSGEHPITVENEFGKVLITTPGTGITIEQGKAPSAPYAWSKEKLQSAVNTITID